MKVIFKLVVRDFLRHRSMLGFAFLSIVAVSCLVVWFVAGIDTEQFAEDNGAKSYYGAYTLAISSENGISDDVLDTLYAMDEIAIIANAFQFNGDIRLEGFREGLKPTGMGDRKMPSVMGISAVKSPFEIEDGRWFEKEMECVVSTQAAKLLTSIAGSETSKEIVPGDKISVKTDNGNFYLTIVGLVEQDDLKKTTLRPSSGRGVSGTFSFGFGLGIGGGRMGGAPAPAPSTQKNTASDSDKKSQALSPVQVQTPRRPPSGGGNRFGARPKTNPATPNIYLSLGDASKIADNAKAINIVYIGLAGETTEEQFYAALEKELGTSLADLKITKHDTRAVKADSSQMSEQTASSIISQAWSTIGIVIIASIFIIFTTLSMGVSEKTRYLAMLRTIGFTRFQVASYIMLEGMALGLLGWLAGLAAGWGLLTFLIYIQNGTIPLVKLTMPCILFAFGCSLFGSLAASAVPAWRATRVSPSESMTRKIHNLTPKRLAVFGITGLILLSSIPVIVFKIPMTIPERVMIFSTIGTLFLGLGFLLFFPWTIVITEKIFARPLAFIMGFDRRFLSNILSGNQWRTLGTTIALSIGLGLFTAINIWSYSMLTMFTVPDTIPNYLVRFQNGVISDTTTQGVQKMPGIIQDRFMRLSVAQPDLDDNLQKTMRAASAMGSNVVAFGVDGDLAYRAENPLLQLRFIEGSPEKAREEFMKPEARVCVIPETLSVHAKLHVGDKIRLKKSSVRAREQRGMPSPYTTATSEDIADEYAEYTVSGVVDFAWTWLTKCSGVRVSAGRTAAAIFTPYEVLIEDFGSKDNEFFWFDALPGTEYADVEDYMIPLAKHASQENPDALRTNSYSGGTLWDSGINRNFVQVSSIESLNNSLNSRAFSVIETMTRMPLIILILSTVAIINTMAVSVRSRRWEMGVLRSCGVTRGGLVRMILSEALLIGICACVMSFSFGLFYSWMATQMVEYAPVFGVSSPRLYIPWNKLLSGYILALCVSLVSGIWPAVATGLKETSSLLQKRD